MDDFYAIILIGTLVWIITLLDEIIVLLEAMQ